MSNAKEFYSDVLNNHIHDAATYGVSMIHANPMGRIDAIDSVSMYKSYEPPTLSVEDLLLIPSLRPKVRRVIKLGKMDRAHWPQNPFTLSRKDFRQLRWIKEVYIPKFHKLFPTD